MEVEADDWRGKKGAIWRTKKRRCLVNHGKRAEQNAFLKIENERV